MPTTATPSVVGTGSLGLGCPIFFLLLLLPWQSIPVHGFFQSPLQLHLLPVSAFGLGRPHRPFHGKNDAGPVSYRFGFFHGQTPVPWPCFSLLTVNVEDDPSISNSSISVSATLPPLDNESATATATSAAKTQWQLLQKLNNSFHYDGRLPLIGGNGNDANENPMDTDRTDIEESNNENINNDNDNPYSYRCGFVSIIGAPNMGKSTLLNALLQQDLSICTARPQTTRHAILGILTTNTTQVCLVDTPGVIETPAYKLQEGMMEAVATSVRDADVLLVVTDVFSTPIPNDALFAKVQKTNKPVIVVVNKIDLAATTTMTKKNPLSTASTDTTNTTEPLSAPTKPTPMDRSVNDTIVQEAVALWRRWLPQSVAILPVAASEGPNQPGVVALRRILCGGPDVAAALRNLGRPVPGMFPTMFPSSTTSFSSVLSSFANTAVTTGTGTTIPSSLTADAAITTSASIPMYQDNKEMHNFMLLPISPPLFEQDALTDRTERFVASEIIRAALFQTLKKELPYCCEVQITDFKEPGDTETAGSKRPLIRISANVIVERDSQKIIVIGKNGVQIKRVGVIAREKLEDFLQAQVHCFH